MKYKNTTSVIVYTYINGDLVAVKPGEIVEVAGYKPPKQLTLVEDMGNPRNIIQRRRFQRLGILPEQQAEKEEPEVVEEEVVPPKPAAKKKTTRKKKATKPTEDAE